MLSVEILADAVLTCGRTARLVSSQTNFNVGVYSAVTTDSEIFLSDSLGGMLGRAVRTYGRTARFISPQTNIDVVFGVYGRVS